MPHQTPDLLHWSLANSVKSSVSAKLKGLGDFRKHAALCLSMLSAKRMILFPMCGGTGSDLTAGDTADLLLCDEFDAAFRKREHKYWDHLLAFKTVVLNLYECKRKGVYF